MGTRKPDKLEPPLGETNVCLLTKGATVHGHFYRSGSKLTVDRHTAEQLVKARACEVIEMRWPEGGELHEFGAPITNQFD